METDTISSSQEKELLREDSDDNISVHIGPYRAQGPGSASTSTKQGGHRPGTGIKATHRAPPEGRKLATLKPMTAERPTEAKPPRNRSRPRRGRSLARVMASDAMTDERSASKVTPDTRKRQRQKDETPPSIDRPSKKPVPPTKSSEGPLVGTGNSSARSHGIGGGSSRRGGGTRPPATKGAVTPGAGVKNPHRLIGIAHNRSVPPGTMTSAPRSAGSSSRSHGIDHNSGNTGSGPSKSEDESTRDDDLGGKDATYAEMAKEGFLTVAVIDARGDDDFDMMDQERFAKVQSALNDLMIQQINDGIIPPTVEGSRLAAGALKVRCSAEARKWLESYIPTISTKDLWRGAQLKVVEFGRMPRPYKFNTWLPGIDNRTTDIFLLIEALNPGVKTNGWTMHNRDWVRNEGTNIIIGVDRESFLTIQGRGGHLFCGIGGKAHFKLVKKSLPKAIHPGKADLDVLKQQDSKPKGPLDDIVDDMKSSLILDSSSEQSLTDDGAGNATVVENVIASDQQGESKP